MSKRVLIIDGHPDRRPERYVHALAQAYTAGARSAGHEVSSIVVSELEFPWLTNAEDFQRGTPPESIRNCQELIRRADHIVILYPLWLGSMPALLKAFFEQTLRPEFAFGAGARGRLPKKLLAGRSARIVVTMGMPAFFYKWYYRAHSLKSLERNILAFCGIRPVRATLAGMVEGMSAAKRKALLETLRDLGGSTR
ncbi:MAG: NAD(P)H-dependent oxidoreductase [Steroidobacteraceae bacterium]